MATRKKSGAASEAAPTQTNLHALLDGHPLDAAYAFQKALNLVCGVGKWQAVSWLAPRWGGDEKMALKHSTEVRVPVGVNKFETISWGRVEAPDFYNGFLAQVIDHKRQRPVLALTGSVTRASMPFVQKLLERTQELLHQGSLFRGKAVQLLRQESRYNQYNDPDVDLFGTLPRFLDLSGVSEDSLLFPATTMHQVKKNLFTPIERSFLARRAAVPMKRGILFEGTYGVGKTLSAFITAKKAERCGWTFVYCDDVDDLEKGIQFGLNYQPAIVYAEDIDQAKGIRERDAKGNRLLNALDSIETKNAALMIVLTTNHLQGITPALLRPGRMDALIRLPPPDAETAERLLRQYGGSLIASDANLLSVRQVLAGQIPAVIREVVERAKLSAISRTENDDDPWQLDQHDLLKEAAEMVDQINLVKNVKEPLRQSKREKAAQLIADAIKAESIHVACLDEVTNK